MRSLHIVMNSPCSMLLTDMMSFFFSLPLTISVPPMDEELSFMCMCASVSHHPFSVAAALSLRVKQRKSLRVRMIQCGQDSRPFIGLEVGASSRHDASNRRSYSYAAASKKKKLLVCGRLRMQESSFCIQIRRSVHRRDSRRHKR